MGTQRRWGWVRRRLESWRGEYRWSRLWAVATSRPLWQRTLAAAVSCWWLLWLFDQFRPHGSRATPLGVLRDVLLGLGARGPTWLDFASVWLREPDHRALLTASAWLAGVLWAAGNQRTLLPTLLGWVMVLVSSEALTYDGAAQRALFGFLSVVLVFLVLSVPRRGRMVDRHFRLLPKDVLLAGGKAAALCVLVASYAAIRVVSLVCAPYLTTPPRRDR
jgi:hypothetical protein